MKPTAPIQAPAGGERVSPRTAAATVALGALLIPGIVLRLWRLEWMEFSGDEITILYESYRAAHEKLALHGIPASIGMRLPSLMLYLLAIPMAFTRDPVRIVLFVAALNLAGIGLFLVFTRRLLGSRTALLATALLACAPWSMLLARKIWNPDFLFPFAMGLYAVLESHLDRPRSWKTALAVLLYAALCQFHASAWLLSIPLVLWWAAFRVPLDRRGLLVGLASALILYAPYLTYLASSGFDDLAYAWNLRGLSAPGATSGWRLLLEHLFVAIQVSTGLGFEDEISAGGSGVVARAARTLPWLAARGFFAWTAIATLWALARSARLFVRALRGESCPRLDALGALFAAILVTVVVTYALASFPPLHHYHAILVPLPLFFAVWLGWCLSSEWKAVMLAAVVATVAGHALLYHGFFEGMREGRPPRTIPYVPPDAASTQAANAELERMYSEVDDGHRRWREEQERSARLFETAPEVLLRFDPARNQPAAIAEGRLGLEPAPEGLVVRGNTPIDMLRLPPFENDLENGGEGRILLRLDLDVPKDGLGLLLYPTRRSDGYRHGQGLDLPLRRGRNLFHFVLPDADANGRIMLRLASWRYVVRAMEVRRAPP